MTLQKKGKYWYGTTPEDIEADLIDYSKGNRQLAVKFAQSTCTCGASVFKLESDEDEGAARRICVRCGVEHFMGDSAEYAAEAELSRHPCICDEEDFELVSGVALYADSNDVRWYYIGCRCVHCNLVGVFADWKCEAGDADAFLAKV